MMLKIDADLLRNEVNGMAQRVEQNRRVLQEMEIVLRKSEGGLQVLQDMLAHAEKDEVVVPSPVAEPVPELLEDEAEDATEAEEM
jgi:hypothetical protein